MTTRAQIVAEARTWLGTPWHHQLSMKGVGCDCGGLVRGVMTGLGLADADPMQWAGVGKFLGYSAWPDGVLLQEACDTYLTPVAQTAMQPGDVVLFVTDKRPQHLGILATHPAYGVPSVIHASIGVRPARVVETRLVFARNLRFVAAYSIPGVT